MKNKIYKVLSILLTIAVVLSTCVCAIGVSAEEVITPYYVQAGATGTPDGTQNAPYPSIADAINAAIANSETGTVYVKVMGTTAAPWGVDLNTQQYADLPTHTFTLNISSADSETKATVGGSRVRVGGPTDFDNITINASDLIAFNGFSVNFTDSANFSGSVTAKLDINNKSVTTPLNINVENNLAVFDFNGWAGNLRADLCVTYNNPNGSITLNPMNNSGLSIWNDLNFNLKAGNVTFGTTGTSTAQSAVYAQIINSTGNEITAETTGVKELIAKTSNKYYILTNTTPEWKNALSFTETPGKYEVGEDYSVTAVNKADNTKVTPATVVDNKKILDLTTDTAGGTGEYDITITKEPRTYSYTASSGETVENILAKAESQNDLTEVDTVEITFAGSTAFDYGSPDAHDYKVVLKSTETTPITFVNKATVMGDTVFDGVSVTLPSTLYFGGHNIEFTETSVISGWLQYTFTGNEYGNLFDQEQTLIFKNKVPDIYFVLGSHKANANYSENLNIIFTNPESKPRIQFKDAGVVKINKTLNLDLGSSTPTAVTAPDTSNYGTGAIQILSNQNLSDTLQSVFDALTTTQISGGVYTIINSTGVDGALNFTDTAGIYTSNLDKDIWTLSVEGQEGAVSSNNTINLPDAGKYTINAIKNPNIVKTLQLSADGFADKEPFNSVEAAISYALGLDLDESSTVNLKVKGTTAVPWGGTADAQLYSNLSAHTFTLNISSADSETKSTVGGSRVRVGGPTNFDNITINASDLIAFNASSVNFTNSANFSGSVTAKLDINNKSVTTPLNINVENNLAVFDFNGWAANLRADLCVTYNNPNGSITLNPMNNVGLSIWNDLNFNLKAGNVTFGTTGTSTAQSAVYAQIINSTGNEITAETTGVKELIAKTGNKYFILTNETNNKDLLSFTDTPGQFTVNVDTTQYRVIATPTSGDSVVAKNGLLSLTTADTYTITMAKAEAQTYKYTATEGETVASILANAESENDLTEKDTVEITFTGSTAFDYGSPAAHNYKVVLKSTDKTPITFVNKACVMGDTVFDGVSVALPSTLYFGGHNIEFTENSVISGWINNYTFTGDEYGNLFEQEQTLIFKNKVPDYFFVIGSHRANANYSENLNIIFTNPESKPRIQFKDAGVVKINKTLNLDLGSSTPAAVTAPDTSNYGTGAIQIISNKNLPDTLQSVFDALTTTQISGGVYTIINSTGIDGALNFTDTAGVYSYSGIDTETYNVSVTDNATGQAVENVVGDAIIGTLTPGNYTVTAQKPQFSYKSFEVSSSGTLNTIEAAIIEANKYDYTANAVVDFKIASDVEWGANDLTDYGYTLNISSVDATKYTVGPNAVQAKEKIMLGGDTNFDNVNVGAYELYFDGNSVNFSSTTSVPTYVKAGVSTGADKVVEKAVNYYFGAYAQYIEINGAYGAYGAKMTFEKSATFTYDSASTPTFYLAQLANTYNGNLNFDLKNATGVSFLSCANAVFGTGSALQIIDSANLGINNTTAGIADIVNKGTVPVYIITNNTGNKNLLTFTDNAGQFVVGGLPNGQKLQVYKDGVQVGDDYSNADLINLSSYGGGQFTLTIYKEAVTYRYEATEGQTVAEILATAVSDGAVLGDKVIITFKDTGTYAYGTPDPHAFDLELIGTTDGTNTTIIDFTANNKLAGDTKFDCVEAKSGTTFFFQGHDVVITETSKISTTYLFTGHKSGTNYSTVQNVVFHNVEKHDITLGCDSGVANYNAGLNLTFTNPDATPNLRFKMNNFANFGGNLNVKMLNGSKLHFIGDVPSTTVGNGALQILSDVKLLDGIETALISFADNNVFGGGVYSVYNKIVGKNDVLGFTEEAGKFSIIDGLGTVRVIKNDKTDYLDVEDTSLNLTSKGSGNYYIGIPHGELTNTRDYYIDYATATNGTVALNNFAAKVNNPEYKKDLNVVYYGGSVTNGQGASDTDTKSWRGLISSWLDINIPTANVTNINSAIGGTCTFTGSYRLQQAVLDQDPDLVFVEYSINDHYSLQQSNIEGKPYTLEMSSSRFETIIRNIRKAKPQCDIVTVLITDRNNANAARKENGSVIHEQAIEHEKIAQEYGVPILYVGKYLADYSQEEWTVDSWLEYSTDLVHLKDKGYAVYAEVVTEFMANSILAAGKNSLTVQNHTVPAMVNDELLDGDILAINATQEMSDASVALGGDAMEFIASPYFKGFPYAFKFLEDDDRVLKFQFTGTEISMVDSGSTEGFAFEVIVDGGEPTVVVESGIQPTVLAQGLEYKTHTVELKQCQEVNETLGFGGKTAEEHRAQTFIAGFYQRNENAATRKNVPEVTYQVSSTGNNSDGSTVENGFNSITEALSKIPAYPSTTKVTLNVNDDVSWGDIATPTHEYELIIDSTNDAAPTISFTDKTVLGGKTEFKNVKNSFDGNKSLHLNLNDVKFSATTGTSSEVIFGTGNGDKESDGQNVVFNNAVTAYLRPTNNTNGNVTHNGDVNITFDNANASPFICLSTVYNATTTYNKNVNIIANNAKNLTFLASIGSGANPTVVANGAVQVIYDDRITTIDNRNNYLTTTIKPAKGVYFIKNNVGDGAVTPVEDEVGKFKVVVPEDYKVAVKDANGDVVEGAIITEGENTYASLSTAGTYTIYLSKVIKYANYFVSASGTEGADGTEGKPFRTIDEAIQYADEQYFDGDEVTLTILDSDTVEWGNTVLTEHTFKLIIDAKVKGTTLGTDKVTFGGPVELKNVKVGPDVAKNIMFGNHDFTIDSTVTFGNYEHEIKFGSDSPTGVPINKVVNAEINSTPNYIVIGNYYGGNTYDKDVNFTLNVPNSSPVVRLAANNGTNQFNAALNMNIKAAKGLNFVVLQDANVAFGQNAAIQIIDSAEATITANTGVLANYDVPKYIINNELGADNVEFTSTIGKYRISGIEEGYKVVILDSQGNDVSEGKITYINGNVYVNLDSAGAYTFEFRRKETKSEVFYVRANAENGTGTKDQPFATIKDAVDAANAKAYLDGDTIKVYVLGDDSISWGENIAQYAFDLEIYGVDDNLQPKVKTIAIAENSNVNLGGNVSLYSIVVLGSSNTSGLHFNNNDVYADKNSKISVYNLSTGNTMGGGAHVTNGQNIKIDGILASSFMQLGSPNHSEIYTKPLNIDIREIINNTLDFTFLFGDDSNVNEYDDINIRIGKYASAYQVFKFVKIGEFTVADTKGISLILGTKNITVTDEVKTFIEENFRTDETAGSYHPHYIIYDHTFQGNMVSVGEKVGIFNLKNLDYDYKTTVKCVRYGEVDPDLGLDEIIGNNTENSYSQVENNLSSSNDGKIIDLTLSNPFYKDVAINNELSDLEMQKELYAAEYYITNDTYFEDFDGMSESEFNYDWNDAVLSGSPLGEDGQSILQNDKLYVEGIASATEKGAIISNKNIQSLNQYVSVDMIGVDLFHIESFAELIVRNSGKAGYHMGFNAGHVYITKYGKQADSISGSNQISKADSGFETENFNFGQLPYTQTFSIPFNKNHTYRMAMSITGGEDGTPAYLRCIVRDITTNKVLFDETYKDTQPLTEEGTVALSLGEYDKDDVRQKAMFDNIYLSTVGFKENDLGEMHSADINGDGYYDVRDLVFAGEEIESNSIAYLNRIDRDFDGTLGSGDTNVIRQEILEDKYIDENDRIAKENEFSYEGQYDNDANNKRQQIEKSASLQYNITGTTYYVSDKADDNSAGTIDDPWSLNDLNLRANLTAGDGVLFERGSEFRLSNVNTTFDLDDVGYAAYVSLVQGVTYGAYGDGDKPVFYDSPMNYKNAEWNETKTGSNIWYCSAPEINIDKNKPDNINPTMDNSAANVIFNDGDIVGRRRSFTGAGNLYTMYQNGDYTYDPESGNLYLYSDNGNPRDVYTEIEVSRGGTYGFVILGSQDNITIDNLEFVGFGAGAIYGTGENDNVDISNCIVGFAGGLADKNETANRFGGGIGFWNGGNNSEITNCYIYQSYDSAISPQGNTGHDYSGFKVEGCLFEYNNCDFELFDDGDEDNHAIWNDVTVTNNIMRFTSLGWGTRSADMIRGIEGVIRGSITNTSKSNIDFEFSNNVIDSPGMQLFKFDNGLTSTTMEDENGKTVDIYTDIFEFEGSTASEDVSRMFGNTYYFNPYIRNTPFVLKEYRISSDSQTNTSGQTYYPALSNISVNDKNELVDAISKIDKGSTYYWFDVPVQ